MNFCTALPEPPAGELRKVRVIERDQRNAAAAGDIGRRPGGMKCIADLDEIGLERVDGARPAHRIERQAVVERAGHQPTRDRGDVAGRMRAVFRRARQAVAPVGVRAHPLVFGEQVTLHAAAGRRVEKRGVDDVHECFLLLLRKYPGVAVVRPVSADSVPYVDKHLQELLPWVALALRSRFRRRTPRISKPRSRPSTARSSRGGGISTRTRNSPTAKCAPRRSSPSTCKLGLEVETGIAKTGVVGVAAAPASPVRRSHCAPTWMRCRSSSAPTCRSSRPRSLTTAARKWASCMPAATIRTPPFSWVSRKSWSSRRAALRGNVLFVFQPAEEGAPPGEVGGASVMLKAGIFEKYKPEVAFGLARVGVVEHRHHRLSQRAVHGRLAGVEGRW